MLIISSREFRQNQRLYFDKADQGEQIIVQRGIDKSYTLTPIKEGEIYFNENMVNRVLKSLKQSKEGKFLEISSSEEINELLGL